MKRILELIKEAFKTRYRIVDNINPTWPYRVEKLHFLNKITGHWEWVDSATSFELAKQIIEKEKNPPKSVEPEIKIYHQE